MNHRLLNLVVAATLSLSSIGCALQGASARIYDADPMMSYSELTDAEVAYDVASSHLRQTSRRAEFVSVSANTDLQRHNVDVALVAVSGDSRVEVAGETQVLRSGAVLTIPAGTTYRALPADSRVLVVATHGLGCVQTATGGLAARVTR